MQTRHFLLSWAVLGLCVTSCLCETATAAPPTEERLEALRYEGPAGLAKLIAARDMLFHDQPVMNPLTQAESSLQQQQVRPAQNVASNASQLAEWNAAIDHVAGARYSHVSGLYWYTDFAQAKAAAIREQKPILSLRLLGKLTDELSCANSRFFRTLLYPHKGISAELSQKFILHWQSVRPAPIITIDFGDGRKIERTITGNSIHYLFAPTGELVDALPGLYGPKAFLDRLQLVEKTCRELNGVDDANERMNKLIAYRNERIQAAKVAWAGDMERVRSQFPPGHVTPALGKVTAGVNEEDFWKILGGLRQQEAQLDEAGIAFVTAMQGPPAPAAGRLAMTKSIAETPAMRVVRNLRGSIGADTAKNDYAFRPQILAWMNGNAELRNVDKLNEMVYAQLFLTPMNDPWLGLQTPDVFSALPKGGVIGTTAGK